jgi:hypothetical protein
MENYYFPEKKSTHKTGMCIVPFALLLFAWNANMMAFATATTLGPWVKATWLRKAQQNCRHNLDLCQNHKTAIPSSNFLFSSLKM